MDQDSNQMEQGPVQCRNGCGFYSNAGTDGLCSVCYKEVIKKKQQPPTGMPSSLAPAPGTMASLSIEESSPVKSSSSSSLETASPTIRLPTSSSSSSLNDKRTEAEEGSVEGASSEAAAASSNDEFENREGKKKRNRCQSCKKKVGLTGFTCRCGGLFCSIHRYSDKHECDFNYKEHGAEEIRKSNPVVVAKKVQQI